MAYARMRAILRNVAKRRDIVLTGVVADWSLFEERGDTKEEEKLPQQRTLLLHLNEFWPTLQSLVVDRCNPAPMCDYLYTMCREFSSW